MWNVLKAIVAIAIVTIAAAPGGASMAQTTYPRVVDVRDCGVTGAFSTDETAAMTTCLALGVSQNRPVWIPFKVTVDGLLLPSGARIECAGRYIAGFVQKTSGTGGAYGATVALADPATTVQVQVSNCGIFGNASNQTVTSGASGITGLFVSNDSGTSPGGSFNPHHSFHDLRIENVAGTCLKIGHYTRDSEFSDLSIYNCGNYGVDDSGVDSERSNINVGSCLADCFYVHDVSNIRYTNIKAWAAGKYTNANTGALGEASNFIFQKTVGVTAVNLQSQEGRGFGFRFAGSGTSEVVDQVFSALSSDADNVSGTNAAGFSAYLLRNSLVQICVGKEQAALAGSGPYNVGAITTSTGNIFRGCGGQGLINYVWAINADSADNSFDFNGSMTRRFSQAVGSSFTATDIYRYSNYSLTLSQNLTIGNPGRKDAGFEIEYELIQDATGGRTTTFGADFVVPAGFIPVTTASARNRIRFRSDGSKWRAISFLAGY